MPARKILKRAELALVRERIAWTRKQLCRGDGSIANLTEDLWMTLNEEHYATAKCMISASSTKTFDKARSTQITKFTKLTSSRRKNCRRQEEDLSSCPLQCTVINMSARKLTPVEENVLALGLNFAVVPCIIPKEEIVQRLEPELYHLKSDAACNIRTRLPRSNLSKNQKDAVGNLRTDKSIHILKADKGNATVILNRTDYDKKILALLNTPAYKELKRDLTANVCSRNYLNLERQVYCLKLFMII